MQNQNSSHHTIIDAIGNTPMVKLHRLSLNPLVNIYVKLEYLNPSHSIKDRIVHYIIDDAEKKGLLKPGGTIVESTSGNTGAAVAMLCASRGYHAILTMPDKVSQEKQNALKAFGAEIVVAKTDASPDSPEHYVSLSKKIAKETPGSFRIDQYDTKLNPKAHYESTAPEIWEQMNGDIDYFIASSSTGGTISGVGKYLKERNEKIQVIMPDPVGSVYYHYFKTGKLPETKGCTYHLEGIGEDHIAGAIDLSIVDDVMEVSDKQAFHICRELAQKEGILGGGSSGANVWAALEIAKKCKKKTNIVTIICDSGIKYLSKIYDDQWMKKQKLL
ncbi:MAG: cysteine synthase family protein [Waddliaceae bacterium]